LSKEKNRTVITAGDLDWEIYTFYANAFLEDDIKARNENSSFVL